METGARGGAGRGEGEIRGGVSQEGSYLQGSTWEVWQATTCKGTNFSLILNKSLTVVWLCLKTKFMLHNICVVV